MAKKSKSSGKTNPIRIQRGLGWVPDLPDHRDHLYSAPLKSLKALPPKVDLKPQFPIYDQGQIGSCTANALAGAVQFDRLVNKQKPNFVPSRLFIYYNERVIEGSVPNDAGAMLRDGIKSLNKQGVCPESEWPYDAAPPPSENAPFPPGSRAIIKPTANCYKDAGKHTIVSYQRLTPTLSQLQGCLASDVPFVFGFSVFDSWYSKKPRPAIISLPTAHDTNVGGHAVLCVGYDNATSLFKIRNSWGASSGKRGYFFMPYAYLTSGNLADDFWVIRTVNA